MYANCIIEYPIKTLDKTFTYLIPKDMNIKVGMKVLVPFNKSLVHGIVLDITNKYDQEYELKEIVRIEDPFLILNKELLELGKKNGKPGPSPIIVYNSKSFPIFLWSLFLASSINFM